MKTDTRREFTTSQLEAINSDSPDILVVAGPGAGKSTVVVERIRRLTWPDKPAGKIVAITFTNAAARELEKKLDQWISNRDLKEGEFVTTEDASPPKAVGFCGTLHAFALRMLRDYAGHHGYGPRLSIISPESASDLLLSKAKSIGCKLALKDLLLLKAKGRPALGKRLSTDETAICAYFDDLRAAGIVDFDVLLTEFARILMEDENVRRLITERFTHLFVDEVQDSSEGDWGIYHGLPIENKFYVGDSDQAIYGFRGGDVHSMMTASTIPGMQIVKLEENFRSKEEICAAADALISHNNQRLEKRTISTRGEGGFVTQMTGAMTEGEEIGAVARLIKQEIESFRRDPSEIAVLCRTNALVHAYATTLTGCEIPVKAREKSSLPPDWAFVRSLVEVLVNPENDTLAFFFLLTIFKKLGAPESDARGMAQSALKAAQSVGGCLNNSNLHLPRGTNAVAALGVCVEKGASAESRMLMAGVIKEIGPDAPVLELALALAQVTGKEENQQLGTSGGVNVMTIHGAKGLEFECVFLIGMEEGSMPFAKTGNVEEDRRLCFVAVTRAKDKLFLAHSLSRVTKWGAVQARQPSRFLRELAAWGPVRGEL